MIDETRTRDNYNRTSVVADFLATLWGKVLALLTIVTLLVGIYVEIIAAWRGTNEGIKAAADASVAQTVAEGQATKMHIEVCVARANFANVMNGTANYLKE